MPVILRQCGWKYTPLASIQAYPEKAKPIKSWSDIDEAYTNVVDGVYLAATEVKKRRSQQQVKQKQIQREQQEQRQAQLDQEAESEQRPTETFEFEVATITEGGLSKKPEVTRTRKRAKCYIEDLGNNIFLDMVAIPGNSFRMGSTESDDEQPVHEVQVAPFFMGRYPITQAQWRVVAGLPKVKIDLEPDPSEFQGSDRPVEQVSWWEAVEFCDRLSNKTNRTYRLPSEAEWEYACRAGTTTPFHFGETITTDLANYRGTDLEFAGKTYPGNYRQGPKGIFREQTTPVGSFQVANAFGLYEMHGNVWEWCADRWHDSYNGAPIDGSAWLTDDENVIRLMRGGSWFNTPSNCRSACRYYSFPDDRYDDIGFRVVCGLT
ncbi:formylglycine-generating enzyme family protein [Cyanobacteria bacterium FACHB-471]|nr:formylglycine-generating enzyme family protein [Cyanobacteria bacterium FACHB-471]